MSADAGPDDTSSGCGPRNVVVILLDSLNRHMVGAYAPVLAQAPEFDTPNLDRFAARAVRFDRHHTGSLPCMPARHDILVGALDFLWRPWGSVEIWEDAVTYDLRRAGVTTMLVSDHPHLFEAGGENYHTDFGAWRYVRGHEGDPWRTAADPSWIGTPALPARVGWIPHAYDESRTWFRSEEDFPGARTMAEAARWLADEAPSAERFMLFVDEFDPHEPFDVPEPWMSRYDPDWDGPRVIWPPYAVDAVASGVIDERTARHIRANYGAKLSFVDHQFGRLLDELDRRDLWDDTAVIVCTDHGHYLGEHDIFGKPSTPVRAVLGHIPLMVAWPGRGPGVVDRLTTTVDIHATICDVFGVTPEHRTHGRSLVPLLDDPAGGPAREWALTGIWGQGVTVTDGRRRYLRAPDPGNRPLSMWSNRWSTMPIHAFPELRLPRPDGRATLERMPGSDVPVIHQPFGPGDPVPYWAAAEGHSQTSLLFDLDDDPAELHDLTGTATEVEMVDLLRAALGEIDAPGDQLVRLGLS
ncbi:MAG TPA: sulfatase-like hydrolase/transferase [Microthrixaceae bacterium]|nr:sulfatase-like hydrolase/transferase [Microthrixaceae bacterium]